MELVKAIKEVEETRGLLESCEDAQGLRDLRKYMAALREDRKALLEKEARLAGTAASEWGCTGLQGLSSVTRGSRDHMLGLPAGAQHIGVSMI